MKNIIVERDNIARKVVELVNTFEACPCACTYQNLGTEAVNLSLASLASAPRIEEDVTGGYTGEFAFAIYLRVFPDDSDDRLDCEQLLTELGEYITSEGETLKLDGGRVVDEIEKTQTAALIARADDGSVTYQAIFSLRYEAKIFGGL